MNQLVEEAEDNLQDEFQAARKVVKSEHKHHYPDSRYEFHYQHCLFRVKVTDPIELLRRLRELHPEDEIDARALFKLKGDLQVSSQQRRAPTIQHNQKYNAKWEEFNIKMQGVGLSDALEEPNQAIVSASFIWDVVRTVPSCGARGAKIIPLE